MQNTNDIIEIEQYFSTNYDEYEKLPYNLYKVSKDGKFGVVRCNNTIMETVAFCEYKDIKEKNGVLFLQTFDDKFGAVSAVDGERIYYDYAAAIETINDNIFVVLEYNSIMLFRFKDGQSISISTDNFDSDKKSTCFDMCEVYGENAEFIKLMSGRTYGLISGDEDGHEILPCIYDELFVQNNHIRVRRVGGVGLFSKQTGQPIINCEKDSIIETEHFYISCSRGKQTVHLKNGCAIVKDVNAEIFVEKDRIIVCQNNNDDGFSCKFYGNDGKPVFLKTYSVYRLIKKLKEMGIECTLGYDGIELCDDSNYLKFYDKQKVGVINTKTLKEVLKCKYGDVKVIKDQGFMVEENGAWGFLGQSGTRVIDSEYDGKNLIEVLQTRNILTVANQQVL